MTKTNSKKALLSSAFALVLSVAMLIGTTFAWFTDTASTGINKIQAGNLDVKLMYSTDMVTWKEATSTTQLFNDDALWEPGHTELVYLKVVNAGNLALKYEMTTNSYDKERGKNANGDLFYIDKYLKIGVAETQNKKFRLPMVGQFLILMPKAPRSQLLFTCRQLLVTKQIMFSLGVILH